MRGWILPAALLVLALGAVAALIAGDRAGGQAADRAWIGLVGLAAGLLLVVVTLSRRQRRGSEPTLLVARDGALRRGAGADGTDPSRRRAVPVVVLGGQAAIVERLGRMSRVLTPGQHTLAPGEVIARVVNTTTRTLAGTLEAATKDGVPVSVEFQLEARVLTEAAPTPARGDVSGRALPGLSLPSHAELPVQDAVVQAANRLPNWELAALHAARNALRDSLERTYLDEIFDFRARGRDSNPFAALADQTRARLDDETRAWGVTVKRVRIGRVTLPPEVVRSAIEAWQHRQEAVSGSAPVSLPAAVAADASAQDDAPPPAKIRLLPIIGRGQAVSLREALRQRLGYVVTSTLDVDGRPHVLQSVGPGPAVDWSLRPDAVLFAVQVGTGGVAGTAASPGDYLLFEQNEALLDGRVIALAEGGQVVLGSASRRRGHYLVQTDGAGEPPLALVESEAELQTVAAAFARDQIEVRTRLAEGCACAGPRRALDARRGWKRSAG